ncbi:MAG: D-alanyl-D-alanine carboxypeptidase/D-alanyl-D-alanine-endopeptidase [Cocleimonas sp.]
MIFVRKSVLQDFLRATCCVALMLGAPAIVDAKKANDKLVKSKPSLAETHYDTEQEVQELPESVSKLLKKYKISADNLSVYIRDLNADKPLLEHQSDKMRSPASTMKLLTTYAGLKGLGPNYAWRTEAWVRGKIDDKGVLDGDLILKGYGDPFLVYENFWKFVKTLRVKGLKEIKGDVIVDNSYFSLSDHDAGAFDGKPFRVYNAQSSPLMFNFQATRFLFKAKLSEEEKERLKTLKKGQKKSKYKSKKRKKRGGKSMGTVEVIPYPNIIGFKFDNQLKLIGGKCRRSHLSPKFLKKEDGTLVIKGNYAKKCGQKFILRSISSPAEHAFNAFRDFWTDLHGIIKGHLRLGRVKAGDQRFHTYSSPTLGEQIRLINKWSNNVMTRQVLLTLGARKYGTPGTLEKGTKAVLDILQENNIDIGTDENNNRIVLENGSGLSRNALISAKQMASLLETAYRDAYMPEFMSSLALPGVDGTLVNRFRKSDLRGRSHFKTGTLNFVATISGYMLNRKGKRLVIVIQHNDKKTGGGRAKKIQNALLRWSFEQ